MTLTELETILLQLQEQVNANTAAITALNNSLSNYATQDDLNAMREQVVELLSANTTLQDAVATMSNRIGKVDHLSTLLDVKTQSLTVNDILQYGNDGRWHNIQPNLIIKNNNTGSNGTVSGTLSGLTDVYIAELEDGHVLTYSTADGKWINLKPSIIV